MARWLRQLHRMADYVVTNSHTNRIMVEHSLPSMTGRIVTVYNTVDLNTFSPAHEEPEAKKSFMRLISVASFQRKKNPLRLIEAIAIVRKSKPSLNINVDWYGGLPSRKNGMADDDLHKECMDLIKIRGLQEQVRLHPPMPNIRDLYRQADAVVLPSFYEGLPNVVCEAMSCGRPVLASNVCDISNLVKDGYNGFVFDPSSPEDMADVIMKFAALSIEQRQLLGRHGREMAERIFDPAVFSGRYLEILKAAATGKQISIEHWLPDVPESAYRPLMQCQ